MLLDVVVDRSVIAADPEDLAFVTLRLVDDGGVLHVTHDRRIEVQVEGPGLLQALGSANPASEDSFTATGCTTFGGRALAIVRPDGEGRITLRAEAEGCAPRRVEIDARA